MSKRELAQLLDSSGVIEAILRARASAGAPWLTVLTYHRVNDTADRQDFDRDVIDATTSELDRQVATLRRYFTVIGIEELLAFMRGGRLPSNPAMITFDDGYRDCHDHALPILLSHGVKGVFFVATSYVTDRRVFWWDRIAYILNRAAGDRIELTYPVRIVLLRSSPMKQRFKTTVDVIKRSPGLDIERFLDELARAAGVKWDSHLERQIADELVMSWDQVKKLREAGMEVHSHTRTHRILQTVPLSELKSELAGARSDLEERLGERVSGVAYPVGRSIAAWPAIRAAVSESGYKLGFSNGSGVSWMGSRFDPLNVRRISVERSLPHSYFRSMLAIPSFAESFERRAP